MSNLKHHLEQNLSFVKYNTLAESLGISQHRLTKILNRPQIMVIEEIKTLGNITGLTIADLINTYDCGKDVITINEMEGLVC